MEDQKKSTTELIQEVQKLELSNLKSTITCFNCTAVFPKEYQNCPKCNFTTNFQEIKIEFEIRG